MHVQWGDAAAWVGSVGSSVALLLTYALLRVTREEQRALREEQRRDQAKSVSAWCETVEPSQASEPDRVTVRLQNASDEPIYGVRVAVGSDWWSEPIQYVEVGLPYVIAPHYSGLHTASIRAGRSVGDTYEQSPPVEVIFCDAGGRFWRRDRYGGLTELTRNLPPSAAKHFFTTPAVTL